MKWHENNELTDMLWTVLVLVAYAVYKSLGLA